MVLKLDEKEEKLIDRLLASLEHKSEIDVIGRMTDSNLHFQGLEIDKARQTVRKNGREIDFTHTEFEILCLLAESPGRVFSKEQIYNHVWDDPYSGCSNIIVTHIRHIRAKMEDEPGKPVFIQTVRGSGYRFNKSICSGS
ncbi:MAG: winged helix-turn-helix transcriptional regulator [Lachnospiraceae bacterium]|nr:winged helix-turn-helix transcriptional regulator [Lachnospiraceae bacterium]